MPDGEITAIRWNGHWIAPEPRALANSPGDFLTGSAGKQAFSRSMFRTTFDVTDPPGTADARLTADSRYVLWVNGREVGRGPARSQPYRQRYDSYDLTPYLVVGRNAIAVLVTYYGEATSFWQPAAAGASPDAALVFEARIGDAMVVSDDTWRVHRSAAWSILRGSHGGEGVPVEILDARQLPPGWREAEFDDSGWAHAALVPATHPASFGQTRPPTYPFGRLLPRGISPLREERIAARRVLDSSLRPAPAWLADHPVTRVLQTLTTEPSRTLEPRLGAAVEIGLGQVHHLALDFGRVVAGFLELRLQAPAGTVVEMYHREKAFHPDRAWSGEDPFTGARYVAAGMDDTFSALELNGLRYLHLVVHASDPAPVLIESVDVREQLYPRTGSAYFRSSDDELDALYRAGIRTVQLNSLDAYTDCPTREQRSWVGDGVVHQMVDLVTNEDWGLARNFLELGDSPRPDGIMPMVVVGDIEASGGLTIPDWSLSWGHGLYLQYWHDGDLDRVSRHLPTYERVLRWFTSYVDDRGTLAEVPEWVLVDWASIFLSGRSSILTALWARSLREFAELSEAVGNSGSARWAAGLYAAAVEGYEDFWDDVRGVYVDHILRPAPTGRLPGRAGLRDHLGVGAGGPLARSGRDHDRSAPAGRSLLGGQRDRRIRPRAVRRTDAGHTAHRLGRRARDGAGRAVLQLRRARRGRAGRPGGTARRPGAPVERVPRRRVRHLRRVLGLGYAGARLELHAHARPGDLRPRHQRRPSPATARCGSRRVRDRCSSWPEPVPTPHGLVEVQVRGIGGRRSAVRSPSWSRPAMPTRTSCRPASHSVMVE